MVADTLDAAAATEVLKVGDAAIGDRMGLDIGPDTIKNYVALLADAKTVVWNGPMGVFEIDKFAAGTNAVAKAVAAVKGTTIIGGGDSIAAIKKAGMADRVTHIPPAAERRSNSRHALCRRRRTTDITMRTPFIAGN